MTPEDIGESPILIDTDVFSYVVWGRGPASWYHRPFLEERIWALSFATVGELRHGALRAKWGSTRHAKLEFRIGLSVVIPATDAVTTAWAELARRYHGQVGRNGNDLWIIACAMAQDPVIPIATHDSLLSEIGMAFNVPIVRAP